MPDNFHSYDDQQSYFLPPSMGNWAPDDSLGRFASDEIEHPERDGKLRGFDAGDREEG